jgi:hypothetical protein
MPVSHSAPGLARTMLDASTAAPPLPVVTEIPVDCICGAHFDVPVKYANSQIRCKTCGGPIDVPDVPLPVIPTTCSCGEVFNVPGRFAGTQVKCKNCGRAMSVRAPAGADTISVACRHCGDGFDAGPEVFGLRIRCPSCAQPFNVPVPSQCRQCGAAFRRSDDACRVCGTIPIDPRLPDAQEKQRAAGKRSAIFSFIVAGIFVIVALVVRTALRGSVPRSDIGLMQFMFVAFAGLYIFAGVLAYKKPLAGSIVGASFFCATALASVIAQGVSQAIIFHGLLIWGFVHAAHAALAAHRQIDAYTSGASKNNTRRIESGLPT